ncbi:MAG: polyribonucleotide nucleotidyltransferase [Fibromonadaceae bacterium]|jgi:polyribonucleotide nucleotidyltransferase|nr:polyribonucleotide nucleotidyltransferase [Fibromonadaceae bacterium]
MQEFKMLKAEEAVAKLPDGREIVFETGRLAKQAAGSAVARMGDAFVLVTVCFGPEKDADFFPLTVEFREKAYAASRLPGGYKRREAQPGDDETLKARVIDRPIRPMFPEGFRREVQVIAQVLSADKNFEADVLGVSAASIAIGVSELPFEEQVAAVRVAIVEGKPIINPTYSQLNVSELDMVVGGTESSVLMVEGGAYEASEQTMIEAIQAGHEAIKVLCKAQTELVNRLAKPKMELKPKALNENAAKITEAVKAVVYDDLCKTLHTPMVKTEHYPAMAALEEKTLASEALVAIIGEDESLKKLAKIAFKDLERDTMRKMILDEGIRIDGRKSADIRDIEIQLGILQRSHGSAVFQRGETQALVTCTLGTKNDEQHIETLQGDVTKSYMLHYNFPPFSVGEVKKMGVSRREIGHGHLAERSLNAVLPTPEGFPYTIRIVSEILESNGSSSMASVCGGSLALMDAGVPISGPVAGIAMGLISEKGSVKEGGKIEILSDITGTEDHLGDMDFKVTGTEAGITAFQMDIKIKGITPELMASALEQARQGRLHIIDKIKEAIPEPRTRLSKLAPVMIQMRVPTTKIRDVIGSGGAVIKKIQAQTGCKVNISDDGSLEIAAPGSRAGAMAKQMIEEITSEPEPNKIYKGKVKSIQPFGAFVEILPGRDGLLHISEITEHRLEKVEDALSLGDEVTVLCLGVDPKGKVKLSMKALLQKNGENGTAAAE